LTASGGLTMTVVFHFVPTFQAEDSFFLEADVLKVF